MTPLKASISAGLFTCITGVSGSGKSTLINDTLYCSAARTLNGASTHPAPHDTTEGLDLGGPVHLHHRRVRLGQVHADQRHAVLLGGAHAQRRVDPSGAA